MKHEQKNVKPKRERERKFVINLTAAKQMWLEERGGLARSRASHSPLSRHLARPIPVSFIHRGWRNARMSKHFVDDVPLSVSVSILPTGRAHRSHQNRSIVIASANPKFTRCVGTRSLHCSQVLTASKYHANETHLKKQIWIIYWLKNQLKSNFRNFF